MSSESKNVIIYARYSSELQNDLSIEDQVAACKRSMEDDEVVTHVFSDRKEGGAFFNTRPGILALVKQIETGNCSIILAESLDRISRTIEYADRIYKLAKFHNVIIRTLLEGEINTVNLCFHGAMGYLQLKQTAERTRRGQIGNVMSGKAGGGLAYGYKVKHLNDAGVPEPGLREIDLEKADIVRSIYQNYADGVPALQIIKRLNEAAIPSPKGGRWRTATITGHFERKDGILQNAIYRGEIVWGRCPEIRHPSTAKRVVKVENAQNWIRQSVEHLRIVDDDLWFKVQKRRAEVYRKHRIPVDFEKFIVSCICRRCGTRMIQPEQKYIICEKFKHHQLCDNNQRYVISEVTDNIFKYLTHLPCTQWQNWVQEKTASYVMAMRQLAETSQMLDHDVTTKITKRELIRNREYLNTLHSIQLELEEMAHPSRLSPESFAKALWQAKTPKQQKSFILQHIQSVTLDRDSDGQIAITALQPNFSAIARLVA